MNKILLLSSGLDSLIAYSMLGNPPCIHCSGHSRYSRKELQVVRQLKSRHPEMKLGIIKNLNWLSEFEEPNANIDARNLLFVDIAAHYADTIYLVCQMGEQSIPDRSPKFFVEISKLLTFLYGKPKKVEPVFPNLTKQDIVKKYLDNGFPVEELWQTYSCFSADTGRCGACAACFRTATCLDYNNVLPDDFFLKDIWKWEGISDYIQRLKEGIYESRRTSQTIEVLQKRGLWQ